MDENQTAQATPEQSAPVDTTVQVPAAEPVLGHTEGPSEFEKLRSLVHSLIERIERHNEKSPHKI